MTFRTHPKNSSSAQQSLFHEDIDSALHGLVSAMGGAKYVGARLYPDLSPDAAGRRLLDALNPERPQQLAHTQFLTLLKWARAAGHHGVMEYICDETGYTRASPKSQEEERAELQKSYIDSVKLLAEIARKLQK